MIRITKEFPQMYVFHKNINTKCMQNEANKDLKLKGQLLSSVDKNKDKTYLK